MPAKYNPNRLYCGRFRPGIEYPERRSTYFVKGHKGLNPKARKTPEQKMDEKAKAERREEIAKENREIQDRARALSDKALKALEKVMESEHATDAAVIQAAMAVLDRGYGKPMAQIVNTNLNADVKPSEVDHDVLDQRINEALTRVERLTSREAKTAEGTERPSNLRFNH